MEKQEANRQMQELGVFVHGVLAGLHMLGLVYNARRGNWVDVTAHGAAAVYDVYAVSKHMKALERESCEVLAS